jgi:hypothetical protein
MPSPSWAERSKNLNQQDKSPKYLTSTIEKSKMMARREEARMITSGASW